MMKLLKYELMRRRNLLLGAAITLLFAEGVALYGIYRGGGWNTLAVVMTVLLTVGGLLLPILDTVTKLYADYKQKQGYMLFLTPRSGYRILWAKTIFGAIETVAAVALIGGCLALSAAALDRFQQGMAAGILLSIQQSMGGVSLDSLLLVYAGLVALEMLAQMAIAILAVTVSRAMVQGNSYNWLIALVMYFALAVGVNAVDSLVLVAFGFIGDITKLMGESVSVSAMSALLAKYFAIGAVFYAAWFAVCTFISGRIASRKLDF
jgi:hypothetical protein